jgi:hypothetical protein
VESHLVDLRSVSTTDVPHTLARPEEFGDYPAYDN